MSAPDVTLRQFGEGAGMPGLAFDARGQAVFRTESGQLLGMERASGEVLVYVALPLDYDAGAWLLQACKAAHHSRLDDWPVQAALREHEGRQHILALTRIAEPEFTDIRLAQALEYLSRWLDASREAR
jgi:type III secretion system chaperone SycN